MDWTQRRKFYEKKILTILLEKYENSRASIGEQGRCPQFRLQKSSLAADYTDELDADKREAIHAAAEELKRQGMIRIVWERHGTGHMERILLACEAAHLYQCMGRTMPLMRVEQCWTALAPLADCQSAWIHAFYEEAEALLARKKFPSFLPKEGTLLQNLIRAILSLPTVSEDTVPKRVFSQHIFGDSKYFEQVLEAPLLNLLRKFTAEPCETDAEYLDMAGISCRQGQLWIAGHLDFTMQGKKFFLADFPGGVGLTSDAIRSMEICAPHSYIMTVENLTNAEALAHEAGEERLLIYTAGFPNRTVQKFLSKIAAADSSHAEMWHWGDLDYGGICIFEYLRKTFFPNLKPFRMGVEDFRRYLPFAQPLKEAQSKRLAALLEREEFSAWHALIREILRQGKWLEQEVMLWRK